MERDAGGVILTDWDSSKERYCVLEKKFMVMLIFLDLWHLKLAFC